MIYGLSLFAILMTNCGVIQAFPRGYLLVNLGEMLFSVLTIQRSTSCCG